ncbi:MAG: efflux RND transporter permease subunit, partial [Planctomycetaceae bacterium]
TTLVVFLPLLFIGDQTGILLRELATVVSFSLVCSLLASLTLTPMLSAQWIPESDGNRSNWLQAGVKRFHSLSRFGLRCAERCYAQLLRSSLRSPLIVTVLLFLVFVVSIGLMPRVGTEFLPKTDEGRLMVNTEMAPGIQLQHLFKQAVQVEQAVVAAVPESTTTASFIGDDADDAEDWNEAWFSIHLISRGDRVRTVEDIRKDLEARVGSVPGMEIKVRVRNDLFGSRMFSSDGENLAVEIRGHDQQTAEELSERIAEAMRRVTGLVNVESAKSDRRPELLVRFDREKASTLGISVSDISQTLETAVHGTRTTIYREDGNEYNVVVRLRESDRSELSHIGQVGVATPDGQIVSLRNLVSASPGESSVSINRQDRQRVRFVTANVEGRDLGHVVGDLQRELNRLPPVEGFVLNIAGDWEEQQKSFRALTWGFVLAVVLMYMVMASQFESLVDPMMILLTLPLAATGVVVVLLGTSTSLNVQSFIGMVMLAGIVVNNAIVLVDYMNQLRRREPEMAIIEIVQRASVRRFRPILMTTLTTVLAMIPIALGLGDGGELQAPMARVVIGGLTSATLITLIAIPLAWRVTHRTPDKATGRLSSLNQNLTQTPAAGKV